jgi:hypothetical protein
MRSALRAVVVAILVAASASPALAQPPAKPLPEPLPMGVPYYYQLGNKYWYAPAVPVNYPYPFGAAVPVYGRYAWDYTGQYSGGFGGASAGYPHYPYSFQYPTLTGRVWMGWGW